MTTEKQIGETFKHEVVLVVVEDLPNTSKCENCVMITACSDQLPICIYRLRKDKKNTHLEFAK